MMRALAHPYAMLALTALLWGGNAVAGKLAVGHISPMVLTTLRWLFACVLLLPFAARDLRKDAAAIRANAGLLFALGAAGFTLFNAIFYVALVHTSAINVMIEQSSMPLVVFVASFVLFGTRAGLWQVVGFGLTLVGVALTAAHGDLSTLLALDLNQGDAMMMGAVLIYGLYTVALRWKPAISWCSLIVALSASACLASLPFLAAEVALGAAIWPADATGLLVLAYVAIFPSIVSQTLYILGVEAIGATRANLFINLTPIFGAGLAVLVLGEPIHPFHGVALALVLGGIMLAERGRRPAGAGTPA